MTAIRRRPIFGLDLFAGAGGMSVGASLAGVQVTHAIELNAIAARTYAMNHPITKVIRADIRTVSADDVTIRPSLDFLFGGPPCQGFSTSNQRTRTRDNPTNWLFREYLRFVRQIRPKWVVFENVKGLLETAGGYFYKRVTGAFVRLGYTVSSFVLNAADYGVPQRRERLFVIASRSGATITPPAKNRHAVTVRDAIADLPSLRIGASTDFLNYKRLPTSEYAARLRGRLKLCGNHLVTNNAAVIARRYAHIPCGGNWEDIPVRLMANYKDRTRCHTGIYYRLRRDTPSIVVGNFRKNMLVHPWEDRGLSVREAARLQSFPDSYRFSGSIGLQQQQVGNAVPPLLARAVFEHIIGGFV